MALQSGSLSPDSTAEPISRLATPLPMADTYVYSSQVLGGSLWDLKSTVSARTDGPMAGHQRFDVISTLYGVKDTLGVDVTILGGAATAMSLAKDTVWTAAVEDSLRFTLTDAYGNIAPVDTTASLKIETTAGPIAGYYPSHDDGDLDGRETRSFTAGKLNVPATFYKAEDSVQVWASFYQGLNNFNAGFLSDTLWLAVDPGVASLDSSFVSVATDSITADGAATVLVTAQLVDSLGNYLSKGGGNVALNTDQGTLLDKTIDNTDGTYTRTLRSTTSLVTANVTGLLEGRLMPQDARVKFVAGPANYFTVAGPDTMVAGVDTLFTITAYDENGNLASSYTGTQSLIFAGAQASPSGEQARVCALSQSTNSGRPSAPSGPTRFNGGPSCTLFGQATDVSFTNGVATPLVRIYDAEGSTLSVSDSDVTTPTPHAVYVHSASTLVDSSVVSADKKELVADETSTLEASVTLSDVYGNTLTRSNGDQVVLFTTEGTFTGTVTYAGAGRYTRTLIAGADLATGELSATVGGTLVASRYSFKQIGGPISATDSDADAPATVVAGSPLAVSLSLYDAYSHEVSSRYGSLDLETTSTLTGAVVDSVRYTESGGFKVYLKATVVDTGVVTVTVDGVSLTTDPIVVLADVATPVASTLLGSGQTEAADGVSAVTLTASMRDAYGNATTAASGSVTFETDLGTLTVTDADPSDDGRSVATLTSTTADTATVIAKLSGVELGRLAVVFEAGAPSMATSTLALSASSMTADDSVQVSVTLRDAEGNLITRASDVVVTSSLDGTVVTTPLAASASSYTAHVSSRAVGTTTIGATVNGSALTATSALAISAGAPSALTSTLAAARASSSIDSTVSVTLSLYDQWGNATQDGSASVVMTASLDEASLTAAATTDGGARYVSELSSTRSGSATVSATLGGVAVTETATVVFLAGAPVAANSDLSLEAAEMTSVDSVAVTLQLRDAASQLTGGLTDAVSIATSLSGTTLGEVTALGGGRYQAYVRTEVIGTTAITATLDGQAAGSADLTITAAPAVGATSSATLSATEASIDESVTVTVTARDALGRPVLGSGNTVSISSAVIGVTVGTVTETATGVFQAELSSDVTGEIALTVVVNDEALASPLAVSFTAGAPSAERSEVTVSASEVIADGVTTTDIGVTLRDRAGNALSIGGYPVEIYTTGGKLEAEVTDNGDGTYSRSLRAPTEPGEAKITASLDGAFIQSTATITFIPGPASVAKSTVTASASEMSADGSALITVTLLDEQGNVPLVMPELVMATDLGSLSAVTDLGDGQYTAELISRQSGTATVSATIDGEAIISMATITVTGGAVDASRSVFSRSASAITVDETVTLQVRVSDSYGNAPSGTVEVTFSANLDGTTITEVTMVADTLYTATLSATKPGVAFITPSVNGTALEKSFVSISAGAASGATSTLTLSQAEMTTYDTVVITVTLFDGQGNAITKGGDVVTITSDLTGTTVSEVSDQGDGSYTAELTSTVGGAATISATVGGEAITETVTIDIADKTSVEALGITEFTLHAAYPNPVASTATLTFDAPEAAELRVSVYNMLGQEVALVHTGMVAPGRHTRTLEAYRLPAGMYIVHMTGGQTRRTVIFTKL